MMRKKPWTRYTVFAQQADYWWQDGKWKSMVDVDQTKAFSNGATARTKASARRIANKCPSGVVSILMRTSRKGGRTREWALTK